MARRDALLRLHKSLMARRDELRKRLGGDLDELGGADTGISGGDSADQAFDSGSEEISSHLAELESRELFQIERALARLRQGSYGHCEVCQKKIPVARLNILPFSTTCVICQRELEINGGRFDQFDSNWENVRDSGDDPRDFDVSKLEIDFSK